MAIGALKDEAGARASWDFCYEILPDVSRTFALTIPVLERPLSGSVCVAYLLCRIADTIEDRNDLELEPRRWFYRQFAEIVADPPELGSGGRVVDSRIDAFLDRWPADANPAYETLVTGLADVIAAYVTLARPHREAINLCVQEMVGGMSEMTHRPPEDGIVYVCSDLAELERYCHYVAGTVGLMLTRLFDANAALDGAFATKSRLEQGRRFGLGLQLTNILKDHHTDLKRGTSFFPKDWIASSGEGLRPEQRASLVGRTLDHLDQAQNYTLALPRQQEGTRLFCLWAAWMAVGTLREIARAKSDNPKITRTEVATILDFTKRKVRDDAALSARYAQLRRQATEAMNALSRVVP
jgi:farnesyl-diphosphate farnesyltransferase